MSTTVLGEGCGRVPISVGECGALGWWRPGVLCVLRVGVVDHKWTAMPPK